MKDRIIDFIRNKVKNANANGVVIGLSGGIDSTTALFLCVESFGKDKILGLIMPSATNKKYDTEDARKICDDLGINYKIVDIEPLLKIFESGLGIDADRIAIGNLKSRIRMCILYYFANRNKLLVVGTGNKSELLQGYFTLYGDGACDLLPLGNLYKNDVIKLARELNVPEKIIKKTPSAGLWKGQTDESELEISYEELDKILPFLENKISVDKVHRETGIEKTKIEKVRNRMVKTEFKRRLPDKP